MTIEYYVRKKRVMKKIVSLFLILVVMLSQVPYASADSILNALDAAEFDRTADDAWDKYVDLLLEYTNTKNLDEKKKLSFGYYNFSTGEEYYYNGDEYMVAASLYKVPLNMIFADGQDPESYAGGIKLKDYQFDTLHHSSNELAQNLWTILGGYDVFKIKAKPYLMDDVDEEVPYNFNFDNIFTARQFIHCLRILGSEPGRFPDILECMKITKEDTSFKRDVQWCEIASKNGYYSDSFSHTVVNDMGIVYTTQTFAIVMMTDNLVNPSDVLADYCTLMCDYTNTRNNARKEAVTELITALDNKEG